MPHSYDLSTLVGCWSSVSVRRIIYKIVYVCPFDYTVFVVRGKVGYPVNRFNHTCWMTVDTPNDRLKSDRNRCVIEVFGGVLCVVVWLSNVLLVNGV